MSGASTAVMVISLCVCGSAEECGCLLVALLGHRLEFAGRLGERNEVDGRSVQRDHLTEISAVSCIGGMNAEASGEDAVVRRRGATALNVPEDGGANFLADPALDLVSELLR